MAVCAGRAVHSSAVALTSLVTLLQDGGVIPDEGWQTDFCAMSNHAQTLLALTCGGLTLMCAYNSKSASLSLRPASASRSAPRSPFQMDNGNVGSVKQEELHGIQSEAADEVRLPHTSLGRLWKGVSVAGLAERT